MTSAKTVEGASSCRVLRVDVGRGVELVVVDGRVEGMHLGLVEHQLD